MGIGKEARCPYTKEGNHHYFVPDVIGVPDEGTVFILAICTACGDSLLKGYKVAKKSKTLLLASTEKQKEQENVVR